MKLKKTMPWVSWVTFLIPGLAQAINKQYIKAIIMFFATLYIYLMAIPYSLGYGNYKGDGIAGLITLAANGGRLDRSIIFMIEGILAIFLLLIGIFLMFICFKDANKVEKDTIKGTRYKSWIETKQTVFEDGFPYLVLSPAAIITIFIVCIPVVTTILLAFTGMGPDTQAKFGWEALKNYKMIFLGEGMIGAIFWRILGWTIVWTIGATTLAIALGFILAIVLNNDRIKGKVLFRSIYLLPWAVPAFISILFFSILFADGGTVVNSLREIFGANFSIKNDPFVIRVVLICIQAWLGSAYIFLLSTGVLQSINAELYEAADIDGATSFKKLTKITVPLVLFQTAPLLVGQYTFNFNNFSIIALFNDGGPFNPTKYGNLAGSSDLLISYIFKLTMNSQYQAIGATITVIISVALIIIAYIGYRNTDAFKRG
ncbi:ABC transporter permease subunit [Clostridium sp.]|uniref:ABC transporter permease subunit n=1 Tax=Clostridium sp. TaxID=1506 RepID=UPI00351FAD1F